MVVACICIIVTEIRLLSIISPQFSHDPSLKYGTLMFCGRSSVWERMFSTPTRVVEIVFTRTIFESIVEYREFP